MKGEITAGQKFGNLTVCAPAGMDESGHKLFTVVCDCGTEFVATGSNLASGRTKSCGCRRRLNLAGQVFGKLTAREYHSSCDGKAVWLCDCECGRQVLALADNLRRGRTTHCGCSRKPRRARAKFQPFTLFPVREPVLDELATGSYHVQ